MADVALNEAGKSGLLTFAGQVTETYTPKLYWPEAYSVYDEMRRRDPTIRTMWNALIMLSRTASWYAEPGGVSDADKQAAEFLQMCLEDMSHTLEDAIEDALSCVLFGWSWLEICYKRREGAGGKHKSIYSDGRIGWRKWAMRRQSSFARWDFDEEGGVRGLYQRPAPDYEERFIPIEKSLHFTSQRDGGNPEGLALLESIYEVWYYLKNYQIIQGIGWQRTFVGLPVFEFEETPSSDDRAKVESVGQALTVDEKQYVSVPRGIKFRLESAQNAGAAALLETIRHYRLLMLQTLLADFIALGTGQTGSWALGADKSQLFLMAVDGYLDRIASVINRFGVPRLMEYNDFPGMTALPRLVHTKVEKPSLTQLGSWLQQVSGLLNWTPEDENWLRQRSGMPTLAVSERTSPMGNGEMAEFAEAEGFTGRDEERAKIEKSLADEIARFLVEQRKRIVEEVQAGRNPAEADDFWEQERERLRQSLMAALIKHINELGRMTVEDIEKSLTSGADWSLINVDALKWARKYVGDKIRDITETTRSSVREAVASWIETGAALPDLVKVLEPTFGRSRAEMIAATEVTDAFAAANDLAWREIGLPPVAFRPAAHPRCRCYLRPVRLTNGEWVVVWSTVKDELVCERPITTPWGRVNGCQALQGIIVSEGDYLGRPLREVQRGG